MATALDEMLERVTQLAGEKRARVESIADKLVTEKWVPNPGPQTRAYRSKADVLLYGGEPGGGKTQLCLGLAFNNHRRSLFMRRNYGDLDRIIEDALKIHGSKKGFNGSPPPKLTVDSEHIIDFGAANRVGDEQSQMGKGRDLLVIDEATHFAETQIRFLMGWVRTEIPEQRTRTVLATNPPLRPEGLWVISMFAPWLDPRYPHPAKTGELRWVISDEDGKDLWVDGPEDIRVINGKEMKPTSRTYIPASVRDNPYYVNSDYERQLDAMPEPYRSLLMGGFRTSFKDVPNQCIPTVWVQLAQKRWTRNHPDVPMCAIGVDASGGGEDPMVMAIRYDGWFDELISIPAKEIPMHESGTWCAGRIISKRRNNALIVVDLGGGYGGPMFEHLKANNIDTQGYKGAESCPRRSRDGKMRFTNTRTAAYWYFREALDPDQPGGSPISLPNDSELMADLTAPTFEATPQGIKLEPKDKVVERIGRSTDRGDAVVMAWFYGDRHANKALEWLDMRQRTPQVLNFKEPLSMRARRGRKN